MSPGPAGASRLDRRQVGIRDRLAEVEVVVEAGRVRSPDRCAPRLVIWVTAPPAPVSARSNAAGSAVDHRLLRDPRMPWGRPVYEPPWTGLEPSTSPAIRSPASRCSSRARACRFLGRSSCSPRRHGPRRGTCRSRWSCSSALSGRPPAQTSATSSAVAAQAVRGALRQRVSSGRGTSLWPAVFARHGDKAVLVAHFVFGVRTGPDARGHGPHAVLAVSGFQRGRRFVWVAARLHRLRPRQQPRLIGALGAIGIGGVVHRGHPVGPCCRSGTCNPPAMTPTPPTRKHAQPTIT